MDELVLLTREVEGKPHYFVRACGLKSLGGSRVMFTPLIDHATPMSGSYADLFIKFLRREHGLADVVTRPAPKSAVTIGPMLKRLSPRVIRAVRMTREVRTRVEFFSMSTPTFRRFLFGKSE
jgi:hypothetical protein